MLKWIVAKTQQLTWPISRKLLFSFGFILLLFILNGAIVFTVQLRISSLDNQEAQKTQIVQQIQNIRRLLKAQSDLFADALFVSDKRTISDNYGGEISDQLRQLREQKEKLGSTGGQLLDNFSASYREILTNFGQITLPTMWQKNC